MKRELNKKAWELWNKLGDVQYRSEKIQIIEDFLSELKQEGVKK